MATFNDQLKSNRLKTLSLDILDQVSGISQRWDTYGVTLSLGNPSAAILLKNTIFTTSCK
ncbi:MAG: hypothetical protein LBC30_00675 [Puniceicoccales bacterium]|jgi:hypothetical protein|nr:hypothetical protein [Puniceicoccales bacterium]